MYVRLFFFPEFSFFSFFTSYIAHPTSFPILMVFSFGDAHFSWFLKEQRNWVLGNSCYVRPASYKGKFNCTAICLEVQKMVIAGFFLDDRPTILPLQLANTGTCLNFHHRASGRNCTLETCYAGGRGGVTMIEYAYL